MFQAVSAEPGSGIPRPNASPEAEGRGSASGPRRGELLRRAERLEALSVAYNVLEGVVAIAAGILAGSAALAGFGFDSLIEVTSAVLLWWRLRSERLGRAAGAGERGERLASRAAGGLLILLAAGIVAESARQIATGSRAEASPLGIALTAISLVWMPLLARAKLRAAAALGSRAMRADAHESVACAYLSATTLAGLGLNAALGWWWADPAAAVLLVPRIAREGLEAVRGEAMEAEE